MSFIIQEKSEYEGLAQEGFLFEQGGAKYYYTSSKQNININSELFISVFIERGPLKNEQDMFKTTLKVTVSDTNPIALKYRTWLEEPILLTLFRQHYGDGDAVVLWSGKVASCKFGDSTAELSCMPLYSTMKKLGILRVFQRSCPHAMYSPLPACGLVKSDWQETVTITNIDSKVVEFSGTFADDYFVGGSAVIGGERRLVLSSGVDSVTIMAEFVQASIGDSMVLLPGCQHDTEICKNTFNNVINNGGFFFIPQKNPFMVSLLG